MLAIFLFSIASVSAGDVNDTAIAGDNTNQMELSSNDKTTEDNLQASDENATLTQANADESLIAKTDSQILTAGEGTYEDLKTEIGDGGDKNLTKSYYRYEGGSTIEITTSGVINGNGAIIDMGGSNIRAFTVSASDVTFKNLTIKNANYSSGGGIVYFDINANGNVINCNFVNNTASGGAISMYGGSVTDCSFTNNSAGSGGAIWIEDNGNVANCIFTNNRATAGDGGAIWTMYANVANCIFTNNLATGNGGAIWIAIGTVTDCSFTNNSAGSGGAIYIEDNGIVTNCIFTNNRANVGGAIWTPEGRVSNCNFTDNKATGSNGWGGAIFMNSATTAVHCTFVNNTASLAGAIYFAKDLGGNVADCIFINNKGSMGNDIYVYSGSLIASNSVFLNSNAGYSIANGSSATVDAKYNFWGTNSKPTLGEGIDVDKWIILNAASVPEDMFAGDEVSIVASFNQTNSTNGDIRSYGNNIPDGVQVTFSSNTENIGTATVKNGKASIQYTVKSTDRQVTITSADAQVILPVLNLTTFSGLQKWINRSNDGDVLNLTDDVTQDTTSPVAISKSITIDGQGHTIDALNISKIFYINEDGVVLKNIDFKNGKGDSGAPVYFMGSGTLINCTFTNNQANGYSGGAVYIMGSGTLINCTFTNNRATTVGSAGAVYIKGLGTVENCTFTNNTACDGGAILFHSSCSVANCIFTDNKATYNNGWGGAICTSSGNIANCTFTNNTAWDGGAVFVFGSGNVTDCTFTNNSADSGGAVYFWRDSNVSDCIFINNKGSGNDIYVNSGSVTASNSAFLNSNAGYSIYIDPSYTAVVNDNFWGTNSKPTPGQFIDVDTWIILNAEYTPKRGLDELNEITITASFNQTNSTGGIGDYAEKLNGVPVTFTANTVRIATVNTKDGIASVKYSVSSEDKQLTVSSGDVVIKLPEKIPVITIEIPDDVKVGDRISINVSCDSDVELSARINGENQTIGADGKIVYQIKYPGIQNITVTSKGTYEYVSMATTENFTAVGNINPVIIINPVDSVTAGENVTIKFSTNSNSTDYTITVNGQSVGNNSDYTTTYAGVYTVIVDVKENDWYNSAYNTTTFTVNPKVKTGTVVNIGSVGSVTAGENVTIKFFTNSNSADYSITVNGNAISNNTLFTTSYSGVYTIIVNVKGNDEFTDGFNSTTFTVNPKVKTGTVVNIGSVGSVTAGENVTIKFSTNSNSTDYTITVNGQSVGNNSDYTTTYAGKYTVIVDVKENEWYNSAYNTTTFIVEPVPVVEKSNATVVIAPIADAKIGDEITIDYSTNSNGTEVTVKVNNQPVSNNKFTPTASGTYTVSVEIAENDYYKSGFNLTTFTVEAVPVIVKANTTVVISPIADAEIGKEIIIEYDTNSNGTAVVKVNNVLITDNKFTPTTSGTYTVTVEIGENDYYKAGFATYAFEVGEHGIVKKDTAIDLDVEIDEYKAVFTVNVDKNATGLVKFNIAGEKTFAVYVDVNYGKAVLEEILKAGNYTVTATYEGSSIYNSNMTSKDFKIKYDEHYSSKFANITVSDGLTISGVLINAQGNPISNAKITYSVGNVNASTTTGADGSFIIKGVKNTEICIDYAGSNIYLPTSISMELKDTVPVRIATSIQGKDYTQYAIEYNAGERGQNFTVKLVDANGKPIRGANITVDLNGEKTYTTDEKGQVTVSTKGLAPKSYTAKITFNGNSKYDKSTKNVKVTVKKATPKITAKAKTFKKSDKTKKYTITLKTNQNKVMKNTKVTLKVNGKTYAAKTNTKGVATFKLTKLTKKGKFTATVKYAGSKYYNAKTVKPKITVK